MRCGANLSFFSFLSIGCIFIFLCFHERFRIKISLFSPLSLQKKKEFSVLSRLGRVTFHSQSPHRQRQSPAQVVVVVFFSRPSLTAPASTSPPSRAPPLLAAAARRVSSAPSLARPGSSGPESGRRSTDLNGSALRRRRVQPIDLADAGSHTGLPSSVSSAGTTCEEGRARISRPQRESLLQFCSSGPKRLISSKEEKIPCAAMERACKNITNVARLVKLLKIDGYCAAKTMGSEDCIKSSWSVGGYDWEIRIYPAMKPPAHDGTPWVAVKLVFLSETCPSIVRANLSCRLVDPRGGLGPSEEMSCIFNRSWIFRCLEMCSPFVNEDCSLPVRLKSTGQLAASGYLRNDSFTVQCTITVLKEDSPAVRIPVKEVSVSSPSLQHHLAELLHNKTGADVTFLVSGKSFAAHKLILAARSPVLMAGFFGHMKETSSQHMEIDDIEPVVFKALLYFIYTDSVLEFNLQHETVTMLAQHLLAAADRYGLDRLKEICEGKLSDGISVDTAATTLALAEQHNCPQLKAKCVEFIVSTPTILDAVLATDGYKHLETSCPMVLPDLLKSARRRNS